MPIRIYKLQNFLDYPELAFKLAFFEPFVWSGNCQRHQPTVWFHMKRFIYIFGTTTLVSQILVMIFNLYMIHTAPEDEFFESGDSIEAVACICYYCCGFYKMWNIFWRRADIGRIMEALNEFFPSAAVQRHLAVAYDNKTAAKAAGYYRFNYYDQKSRYMMRLLTQYFLFAYGFFNTIPILQLIYEQFSAHQSVTYKAQSNTWYPWENHKNHYTFVGFVFKFLVQAFANYVSISFIMIGEHLFCFLTTQLLLHFDYLNTALESLDASAPDALNELKTLINYHNHLLRLFQQINSIFNLTFTLDLINSTFAISAMGLAMLMLSFSRGIMFSTGFSFFLILSFIFCRNGGDIVTLSNKMNAALFYSNWYEGTIEYRRMIIFLIMRTNRPCEYRAYGYAALCMETYMRMLKLSYQIFTSFRAIE